MSESYTKSELNGVVEKTKVGLLCSVILVIEIILVIVIVIVNYPTLLLWDVTRGSAGNLHRVLELVTMESKQCRYQGKPR